MNLAGKSNPKLFINQLPERLKQEMDLGQKLGVKPIKIGEDRFDFIINEGTIKWVVTREEELLVIPHTVGAREISHTVLTAGEAVLAAGEAEIAGEKGEYFMISISNYSGHYQPSEYSLNIGIEAFRKKGINPTDAEKIIKRR